MDGKLKIQRLPILHTKTKEALVVTCKYLMQPENVQGAGCSSSLVWFTTTWNGNRQGCGDAVQWSAEKDDDVTGRWIVGMSRYE